MDVFGKNYSCVKEEIVELTQKLISFRTVKGNGREIDRCFSFIEGYFEDFEICSFEKNGDKSLVISKDEEPNPDILLHGHIDVVEAKDDLFAPEVENGKIFGRGAADMKAGVACLMKALKDFSQQKSDPSVALMLTSDEERGGFNGAGYLVNEKGYRPNFAISAEPNSDEAEGDIVVEQKGVLQLKISCEGEQGHGSRARELENAAEKLIKSYTHIREFFGGNGTTLNISYIEAGDAINKVPGSAEATLDIRYTDEYDASQVLEDIGAIEGLEVEVVARAPMLKNDPQNFYIQELKQSCRKKKGRGELYRKKSASDMRFFTEKGIPAVVFGPDGYNQHGENEFADISGLEEYYEVIVDFLERCLDD